MNPNVLITCIKSNASVQTSAATAFLKAAEKKGKTK